MIRSSLTLADFRRAAKELSQASISWESYPNKVPDETPLDKQAISTLFSQWSVYPNDVFAPSGPTRNILDAGVYKVLPTQMGPVFSRMKVITDDLIELDDAASQRVLSSMKHFWASKEEYTRRGILYKRGILLEGPAGSGKTSTVNLLTKTLVAMNGIVIVCGDPRLLGDGLAALRRIEPDRNIIVVFEDIDEMIDHYGEHSLLSVLDGEHQVDNVVSVASTNFPEKLGARICNRPSRFDERIFVGMPNDKARDKYIRHVTRDEAITNEEVIKWVSDTDGFSVAHLRELAVAVFCLKQPYEEVLTRLQAMQTRPKPIQEFKKALGGFQQAYEAVQELEDV